MKEILKVSHLSKKYGKQTVLNDISFSINQGEIIGLVGPNGAGKTTLMKIITGLTPKYEGEIYLENKNIKSLDSPETKRIGCVIENPGFYPNLSGYENLLFFSEVSGLKDITELNELIEALQLQDIIHKKAKKYSLGMKQRLGIAQALLTYPKLLILDEPTNGLDPDILPEIRKLIIDIAKTKKVAILISSHNLMELDLMCDNVLFIAKGKLLEQKNTVTSTTKTLIKIKTSKPDKLKEFLLSINIKICEAEDNTFILEVEKNEIETLTATIFENKIPISSLEEIKENLEQKYSKIIGGEYID